MTARTLDATLRFGTAPRAAPWAGPWTARGVAATLVGLVTLAAIAMALALPQISSGHGDGDFMAALDGGYRMIRG